MALTEADVVEIVGWLADADVAVWLDGGWGVDALIGEQTRPHKDLDLIVRDDHVSRMRNALSEHGFRVTRGVEQVRLADGPLRRSVLYGSARSKVGEHLLGDGVEDVPEVHAHRVD